MTGQAPLALALVAGRSPPPPTPPTPPTPPSPRFLPPVRTGVADTGTGDVPSDGTADRAVIPRVVERLMEPLTEGAFRRENSSSESVSLRSSKSRRRRRRSSVLRGGEQGDAGERRPDTNAGEWRPEGGREADMAGQPCQVRVK